MFSGIIEQKGRVLNVQAKKKFTEIQIAFQKKIKDIDAGESIAVNGVCLTVTRFTEEFFVAQVIGETLKATNLGFLKKGSSVNLERALRYEGKVSGHFVSGHVDGRGTIKQILQKNKDCYFDIECPAGLMPFLIEKGSVAIDGISLTVQSVYGRKVRISIIPHTLKVTNLGDRVAGQIVNLEIDLIARYAQKQLCAKKTKSSLSLSQLKKMGF